MDGDDAKPAPHSSNGVHISSGGSIGSTGAKGFKGHSLSNPSLPDSGSSTLSSSPDWLQFGNFYDRKQAGSPSLYSASCTCATHCCPLLSIVLLLVAVVAVVAVVARVDGAVVVG